MLVTGGAKGIGRMISEGFVANGATVYISSRDAKSCDQAVNELNALGKGKAHAIPANFYKEEECQRLAEELKKREGSEFVPIAGQGFLRLQKNINRLTFSILPFARAPRPCQQLRFELGCPVR